MIRRTGIRSLLVLPVLAAGLVLAAPAADAARQREVGEVTARSTDGPPPSTPEPSAALVFAVGIGAVAWAVRRYKAR